MKTKTGTKIRKTNDAVKSFVKQLKKLLLNTMKKLKKIWLSTIVLVCTVIAVQACNVTRKVTTEASYVQKGDTTMTIVTKTIETYDASKNK